MEYRIEKDTMGEVKVPINQYWGAQTERSRNNFKIGDPASMPKEIIAGFAYLKKAAAYTNCELGVLSVEKRDAISQVCDEILEGVINEILTLPDSVDTFWMQNHEMYQLTTTVFESVVSRSCTFC